MKIIYDPQIFSAQEYGGISRYIVDLCMRLKGYGDLQIKVIAPFNINKYAQKIPKSIFFGFSIGKSKNQTLNLVYRGLGFIVGHFFMYIYRPDVIHETYYLSYRLGPRRTKRVLTIHDMIHEKFPYEVQAPQRLIKHKKIAAQRANHIICNSKSTQRDVVEILGVPIEKTTVIYLGLSPQISPIESVQKQSSKFSPPYILFVGGRLGYKNFLNFIGAYANSEYLSSNFEIVCFGGGEFSQEELRHIVGAGLDACRIRQVSGGDGILSEYYANASLFVYPSLYEGFGLPPLEAMSNSCPIACSNTSSIPEVVGKAGIYFNPLDKESMRVSMETVLKSPDMQRQLVIEGNKQVQLFSIDECAQKTLDVYRKLTQSKYSF